MKAGLVVHRGTVQVPAYKRVATLDGRGWTSVRDGTRSAEVVLELDIDELIKEYGSRALESKGKKSSLAAGAIKARVVGTITHTPGVQ